MNTKIETTNYDVVLSGVVIIPKDEALIFNIDVLKIVISFENVDNEQIVNGFSASVKTEDTVLCGDCGTNFC